MFDTSPQTILFHEAILNSDFDDEPEAAEANSSVAKAKKLMSTPRATIAALNAFSLRLCSLRIKNTPLDALAEPIDDYYCSYDIHVTYLRERAAYENFCQRPASGPPHHSHFARAMEKLQLSYPTPLTELAVKRTKYFIDAQQFDDADFLIPRIHSRSSLVLVEP